MHLVSQLVAGDTPSTKAGREHIESLVEQRYVLVVLSRSEEEQVLSVRNLPQVHLLMVDQLNTYDVLNNEDVIFTEAAIRQFISDKTGQEA